ncbi:hypothetical protein DFS33DRAFT_1482254 [Desarmillaria ectypa]|nr:hypothetical protein DFS33DRAFT_1482254 [Desarmillaria ectypa]
MSTSNWMPCAGCSCPNHHFPPQNTVSENSSFTTMDLNRLMRSNDLPLPAEADAIRGMISEHEVRVAATDSRISVLSAFRQDMVDLISKTSKMVAALYGEHERILVEIWEKKCLPSAVRRLPPEILSNIFRETIEFPVKFTQSDRDAFWWNFTPVQCSLWAIELVSQRWRTVALDFPELWSYVNIMITNNGFAEGEYSLIWRLGLQLASSQQSLLSLSTYDDGTASSSYEKLSSSLELLLFSVFNRLRELHLDVTAEVFSAILPLQLSLPSLETLSVLCTNALEISNCSDLQLICNAPKLRDLTFMDVEDPTETFAIPWAQITHCGISQAYRFDESPGPDPFRFLEVLQLMTNLTNCDLVCQAFSVEFETEQVECSKLQEISLMSWPNSSESVLQLFSGLELSSLSRLRTKCAVESAQTDDEVTFRSIRHAINVSQSPLTILEFEHGLVAEEDLFSILRTTPTLELLKLVNIGPNAITDQTLDELTVRANEDPIIPRLSGLYLGTEMTFAPQKFVTMVQSRWLENGSLGVESLKSASVCWFTDSDNPDENEALGIVVLSSLDLYRSEGLEFVLTTQKCPQRQ